MKTNLDYSTTIPHHEDSEAVLKVSITNYEDGARMYVTGEEKQCIVFTREELSTLLEIMLRYHDAKQVLEGGKS
jgi:hypothetical protein